LALQQNPREECVNGRTLGAAALVILTAALGWFVLGEAEKGAPLHLAAITAESVGPETKSALGSVVGLMKSVKDPASADAVLPAIQAVTIKLNAIAAVGATLPDADKAGLAKLSEPLAGDVQSEIMRIQAIPGAYDVMKGKMERLLLMLNIINGKSYEVLGTLDNPS
jgi:hypothetical protein